MQTRWPLMVICATSAISVTRSMLWRMNICPAVQVCSGVTSSPMSCSRGRQQAAFSVAQTEDVVLLTDHQFLHQHWCAPDAGDAVEGFVQLLRRRRQMGLVEASLDVDRIAQLQGQCSQGVRVVGHQGSRRRYIEPCAESIQVGLGALVQRLLARQQAADAARLEFRLQLDVVVQLRIQAGDQEIDRFGLQYLVQPVQGRLGARSGKGHQVGDVRSAPVMAVQAAFQRVVGQTDDTQLGETTAQAGGYRCAGLWIITAMQASDGDVDHGAPLAGSNRRPSGSSAVRLLRKS